MTARDIDSFTRSRNAWANRHDYDPMLFIKCRSWDEVMTEDRRLRKLPPQRPSPDALLATELEAREPPPIGGPQTYYATIPQRRPRILPRWAYYGVLVPFGIFILAEFAGWWVLGDIDWNWTIDMIIVGGALALTAGEAGR